MRDNGNEDARKGGGGWINEGGRNHDTNSFDVENRGAGADERGGAL